MEPLPAAPVTPAAAPEDNFSHPSSSRQEPLDLLAWARSSVNSWNSGDGHVVNKLHYIPLSLGSEGRLQAHSSRVSVHAPDYSDDVRLCNSFMFKPYGNRSCFDICK